MGASYPCCEIQHHHELYAIRTLLVSGLSFNPDKAEMRPFSRTPAKKPWLRPPGVTRVINAGSKIDCVLVSRPFRGPLLIPQSIGQQCDCGKATIGMSQADAKHSAKKGAQQVFILDPHRLSVHLLACLAGQRSVMFAKQKNGVHTVCLCQN